MSKIKKTYCNKYEIIRELGEGGNAKVYYVKSKNDSNFYALKDLIVNGKEKYTRFINEIKIIQNYSSQIEGIIPIVDYSIDEYWYVMPIAIPIMAYIIKDNIDILDIIQGTIKLCYTLEKLHNNNISHRDIKPSNIYFYNNRFYLADFGLAELIGETNYYTKSDKGLGAIFTIAPEMKRNPKEADGKKADVFSLAKTIWMLLTKDEKGFDGIYNYLDPSHSLQYIEKYRNTHLVEINELLIEATDNDSNNRPDIKEFREKLENWVEIYLDDYKSQISDWNFLNKQLFGSIPPKSASWENNKEIIEILNTIGQNPAYNHMFFHTGGGLDFSYAKIAEENGCIKLFTTDDFCYILKPKILYFESFNDCRWNYFLLELDNLKPIIEDSPFDDREHLVEDSPGHYVSAKYVQYGVYDYDTGVPLPDTYQEVCRYTTGKFLFVMKKGPYNKIRATYDGRHGDCSHIYFKNYIKSLMDALNNIKIKYDNKIEAISNEQLEENILNSDSFSKNPFKRDTTFDKFKDKDYIQQQVTKKNYVKNNFRNWNFKEILETYSGSDSNKIQFTFEFCNQIDSLFTNTFYICNDGYIREANLVSKKDYYYIYDRNLATDLKNKLNQKILELLKMADIKTDEENENYFSIEITKIGKPSHLFTKQEIREEMLKADDRVDNQLVIDENGYAKVISNNQGYLFPVRYETWIAGNRYVGKYSSLLTLDENYIFLLEGWLLYLTTGKSKYADYFIDKNIDENTLLEKIKKYY